MEEDKGEEGGDEEERRGGGRERCPLVGAFLHPKYVHHTH